MSERRASVSRVGHGAVGVLRLGHDAVPELVAAAGNALGAPLPLLPNRAVGAAPRVLWTAPGEWIVLDASREQLAALQEACAGALWHYADLTDGVAAFELAGEGAADLLAAECPLDLSEAALPYGRCAESLFADVTIVVDRPAPGPTLRVYVDASVADYFAAWLEAVANASEPHRPAWPVGRRLAPVQA